MNFVSSRLKHVAFVLILVFVTVGVGHTAYGKVGVGMGAGEVRVTEDIKPGGIYTLPALRIFNTGDETTTYAMNVAYHQDNLQMRPAKSWFSFEPTTFTIEPGSSQEVFVSMVVPVKSEPGEYFAFIESGPVLEQQNTTSVGVAVATKLYFTVVPANIWQAILYRTSAFMDTYAPWTWIVLGIGVLMVLVKIFMRFFSLQISVRSGKGSE